MKILKYNEIVVDDDSEFDEGMVYPPEGISKFIVAGCDEYDPEREGWTFDTKEEAFAKYKKLSARYKNDYCIFEKNTRILTSEELEFLETTYKYNL